MATDNFIPQDDSLLRQNSYDTDCALLPEELTEIPTYKDSKSCDSKLIEETRTRLSKSYDERPENFYKFDIDLLLHDDWSMSRFLLRCRSDPKKTVKLVEECGKFRKQYKMGEAQLCDFPREIHEVGGLFRYAPDRVGNITFWMRVRHHRRCSDLTTIMKQFLLCVLEDCDKVSKGRGVAVVFDLSDCGIKNADPAFLYWLLTSFRDYCPKGLSYILVYNLPWVLRATCQLALSWLSATNKKRLRFINNDEIKTFIADENLPDFAGGTCQEDYKRVPEHCKSVAKYLDGDGLIRINEKTIKKIEETHKRVLEAENQL